MERMTSISAIRATGHRALVVLALISAVTGAALATCNWYSMFPGTNSCDGWNCGLGCDKLTPGQFHFGCNDAYGGCCACQWNTGSCKPPGVNCGAGWVDATKQSLDSGECTGLTMPACQAREEPPGGG